MDQTCALCNHSTHDKTRSVFVILNVHDDWPRRMSKDVDATLVRRKSRKKFLILEVGVVHHRQRKIVVLLALHIIS